LSTCDGSTQHDHDNAKLNLYARFVVDNNYVDVHIEKLKTNETLRHD